MQENPKTEGRNSVAEPVAPAGMDRRSLIRAGLAGAPVLLGLTSKSAMAGTTHVTCSVWSSFKASSKSCLSHGALTGGGTCKSYNYWKGQTYYPNFCSDYRNSRFHSVTNKYCPPFSGSKYGTGYTMRDICNLGGTTAVDKLARHCAALYLSAKEDSASCPITTSTCRTIWQNCSAGGTWTPYAGATPWTIDDCNDYFDYVCGISNGRNPAGAIPVCA